MLKAMKRWEHFSHEADVGIRGIGELLSDAFEMAGLATTACITQPSSIIPKETIEVECAAEDSEYLLFEWLNQIIYEMDTRRMLFSTFRLQIKNHALKASLLGERVDIERHQPPVLIKGATMTELKVVQQQGLWIAQCVLDV